MGRSWWMLVASGRHARRRAGDALWAARYPARRGLHSTGARLAAWWRGRMDALAPLQIRWQRASGGRRAAVTMLALLSSVLAAVVGVSLLPSAEGEPRSAPEAVRVADGVATGAVERGPASEAKRSPPQTPKATPAPAAAGAAGVGVATAAAKGAASATPAESLPAPDGDGTPDAGGGPNSGAPNSAPSPPQDFDGDGGLSVGPRGRVPSGGDPGTRKPSAGAPRPSPPSGGDPGTREPSAGAPRPSPPSGDGGTPQPAPTLPAVPLPEVPDAPPVGTTPELPEPDEDGGSGGGSGGGNGNGPPAGGPPGQGDGNGPGGD